MRRFALLILGLSGCGDAVGSGRRVVAGVDLDALFAPPTPAEVSAVEDEWRGRDVSTQDVQVAASSPVSLGPTTANLRVVSHTVAGVRHYGAIVVPANAAPASLPILVVGHGGDGGLNVNQLLTLLTLGLGGAADDFVYVTPAFRSEPLVFQGVTYASEGEPSPWDRDVDDALALLNTTIDLTPEADSTRIAVVGFSRGAAVGLLMAIRDPRIAGVVEYFGPADFFGPFVQQVVEEALMGRPRYLPGLTHLDARFIQPLQRGELTIDDVRSELVRRSAVYFASRIPQLQVHHGTADSVVPVGEAERLIQVMRDAGRGAPEFESYLYPGGRHDLLSLPGSTERTIAFLGRVLSGAAAGYAGSSMSSNRSHRW